MELAECVHAYYVRTVGAGGDTSPSRNSIKSSQQAATLGVFVSGRITKEQRI